MATHVEGGMVGTRVWSIGFTLWVKPCMPLIDQVFLTINRSRWALDWLLRTIVIQTFVENLALMGEVTRAGLFSRRRVTVRTTLTHFLRLFKPLSQNSFVRNKKN